MYPVAALETERLDALRATNILDSPPSIEFDALTRHVSDLFEVPICLISLVDVDRQWFKAKCGLDVESTRRDIAFCNYTIVSDDVFVVEDAARDPRFKMNPLVLGKPHVRFYAGAPLELRPGIVLGSLCVIGTEPRSVSAGEILALQRLAIVAIGLIRCHSLALEASRHADAVEKQKLMLAGQARELDVRERRFLQAERMAQVGSWELDLATNAIVWSDETYRIYETPRESSIDMERAMSVFPPPQRQRLEAIIDSTLRDGVGFDEELEIVTALGTKKWVRSVGDVEYHDDVPRRLFGTLQDISERHRTETRLWQSANRDALTGLANRNCFNDVLDDVFAQIDGAPGLLMVDADRLKEVNDTLGHEAGDELIRTIATRLSHVVGETGTVARLGGDEFAILVTGPVSIEQLHALASLVLEAMDAPFRFQGITLKPQVSIGATVGSKTSGPEILRQEADLALYHAKATRRGGYVAFHEQLRSAITIRMGAINVVEDALATTGLVAWYQPIVDLATGRVSGLEALARVRIGDQIHSIGEFADALQERRTAARITVRMLERVEADVLAWKTAGVKIPRIAINAGSADFEGGELESLILAMCERAELAPSQLTLEVTESVFLSRDADNVAQIAARLRKKGVIVALDDFGTGYASLAHLGSFPVDVIKMDRSFVASVSESGPRSIICSTLVELAHKLGIQVIAEGVETNEQLRSLTELGCENAQGYLFAPPMAPSNLSRFLKDFRMPGPASGFAFATSRTRRASGRLRKLFVNGVMDNSKIDEDSP